MKVVLKAYTQDVPGFDEEAQRSLLGLIEEFARVSNPDAASQDKEPGRLAKYLVKHKHWSPFEMVNAVLEVNTTRDIARQLLRHRSFTFQEFSQRYADPSKLKDAVVIREARLQDLKNRQNSIQTDDDELKSQWIAKQQQVTHEAWLAYRWAIDNGIAKEQARSVLPEGNTASRLFVNGTLRSWIHYIDLRSAPGTQLEHRELAIACGRELEPHFPMIKDFIHDEDIA